MRLHLLFRDADTLGSLIDPRRVTEIAGNGSPQQSLEDVNWDAVAPLLATAAVSEPTTDPAMAVLGADAAGLAVAANLLSRGYTLVATNVPYLSRTKQAPALAEFCSRAFPKGTPDLAVAFLLRLATFVVPGGTYAALFPEKPLNLNAYRRYREWTLTEQVWDCCAVLGARGFSTPMFDFGVVMAILSNARPSGGATTAALDVSRESGTDHKAAKLRNGAITTIAQSAHSANPDSRFLLSQQDVGALLSQYAESTQGICTGDYPRFGRLFWELPHIDGPWERQQSTVPTTLPWGGRDHVLYWEGGDGQLRRDVRLRLGPGREGAWLRGLDFLARIVQ